MEPKKYLWRWVAMSAVTMLESFFFKKEMDQKQNFHPLLPIFSENQVSRWKSWLLFHWLYWVGSKKCKNLQESTKKLLKLSCYDHTNGKVLSVSTSLHGFLLACRLHNLMDPGSNLVGSKKSFFDHFRSIFRWKSEIFLLLIPSNCTFYDIR